ncbi:MAG TPA: bifunctional glycoside hydrolase 114/ polysaccharide deacetylase family protein [Burkholderiales bacterium]|nr:bifunctional glycoside hydrolase 114/ polysaccharide deacetylase family protein [Burkholderiales bacterium]
MSFPLRSLLGLVFCLTSLASFAAAPNVAFFYGANPPWDELQAFDAVVVEPGHGHAIDPRLHSSTRSELFAYVSVGEVDSQRPYAAAAKAWSTGRNEHWDSLVIDQTRPEWRRFFIDQVITPLWQAGYRGFFLDNLDSFHIIAKTDEARARQQAGLIDVIREIHTQYPEAKLIFNRGFEILPQVHADVYAVAAESLFRGWNSQQSEYVEVAQTDREWLLGQLERVRSEYKLPVIAIEYTPPGERDSARDAARKVAALGFVPWVTNSDVDQLGLGSIEVMPRKVLMLYEGDGSEFSLMDHRIHRLATMPLNYLGYTAEYLDITRDPLPAYPLAGRYAGIVTWFARDQMGRKGVSEWFEKQRKDGVKMAMLGTLPFVPDSLTAKNFGLAGGAPRKPAQTVKMATRDPLIGFEAPPSPSRSDFFPLHAANAKTLLRVTSDQGDAMDASALTAWGGYVLSPYELLSLPGDLGDRWIVQPMEFFRRALALPSMPVPDVTTENGRRLMMVHVDGDGFVNRAERAGTPYSGEVLLNDVLKKYRIPHSVSIIQGEIGPTGLYPKESPALEDVARRIFALPNVEIASHTFSHPFRWAPEENDVDPEAYHLNIPGYAFSLKAEIDGSLEYINSRLAPEGKKAEMIFWPGDANPGEAALARVAADHALNLNGGDTTITRRNRTLTRVAAVGLQKGPYFQVYAPITNENQYTNLWTGPFYGFQRVIETFELTERPYRLKPIDIYYHFYSASKHASLQALENVYDWALRQPVMNVYASEYARKVLDFNHLVVARSPEGWLVRGGGALRELRVPAALGMPDISQSVGISGFEDHGDDRYVHMAGSDALLRTGSQEASQPYLVEANGRLSAWHRDGAESGFDLSAYVPLHFSMANVAGCSVQGNGKPLSGTAVGGITSYDLKTDRTERISISCSPAAKRSNADVPAHAAADHASPPAAS